MKNDGLPDSATPERKSPCAMIKGDGSPCMARRVGGGEYCVLHDPVLGAKVREKAAEGRKAKRERQAASGQGSSQYDKNPGSRGRRSGSGTGLGELDRATIGGASSPPITSDPRERLIWEMNHSLNPSSRVAAARELADMEVVERNKPLPAIEALHRLPVEDLHELLRQCLETTPEELRAQQLKSLMPLTEDELESVRRPPPQRQS